MDNAEEQNGRERRQHERFIFLKRVEVSTATKTYDGILRDIRSAERQYRSEGLSTKQISLQSILTI